MKRLWKQVPGWLRVVLALIASLVLLAAAIGGGTWWYFHPTHTRSDGIVYGQRNGKPLTLDIVRPEKPNGIGIALMVSGGWKSGRPGETPAWLMAPLLRGGYTIFAICHISQPEATVMEIIQDVNHGVRFVRHHAEEYGIDPDHIGVTGGSAGGHLSLMLATRGGVGDEHAKDPVDRRSSAVQAVAIFYPVTDLLTLGESTENPGDGGPPTSFVEGFGFESPFDAASTNMHVWQIIGRESSPIYHVNSNLPPTLIYHGDADTLVPLDQSERYVERVEELGQKIELVVHSGGEHGWLTMIWDLVRFAGWFDEHLR